MDTVLLHGDCLEWIPKLPKHSVDLIFADLPYGTIKEGKLKSIDKMIPLAPMWECFKHVLKPSGVVLAFGTQPFASMLVMSNLDWFRYDLIWHTKKSGFLNCNNRPMKEHQQINVFSERAPVWNPAVKSKRTSEAIRRGTMYGHNENKPGNLYDPENHPKVVPVRKGLLVTVEPGHSVYNPQMTNGKPYKRNGSGKDPNGIYGEYKANGGSVLPRPKSLDCENDGTRYYPGTIIETPVYNPQMEPGAPYIVKRRSGFSDVYRKQRQNGSNNIGTRHPSSVLNFRQASHKNIHPFEKPLGLVEWLIKTYSNPGMQILDPTMGGGTSGIACRRLGRLFIGIEQEKKWYTIATDRIYSTQKGNNESSIGNNGSDDEGAGRRHEGAEGA